MAIDEQMIARINELARKKKQNILTKEEEQEQKKLRQKYIEAIKNDMKKTLDNIDITDILILENYNLEDIQSQLINTEGILNIKEENKKIEIMYEVKKITEKEIINKLNLKKL